MNDSTRRAFLGSAAAAIGGVALAPGIHLIEAAAPDDRGQHVALRVADLAASVAELRRAGLTISDPSPVGSGLQAFLHDPAGNLVELHQADVAAEA